MNKVATRVCRSFSCKHETTGIGRFQIHPRQAICLHRGTELKTTCPLLASPTTEFHCLLSMNRTSSDQSNEFQIFKTRWKVRRISHNLCTLYTCFHVPSTSLYYSKTKYSHSTVQRYTTALETVFRFDVTADSDTHSTAVHYVVLVLDYSVLIVPVTVLVPISWDHLHNRRISTEDYRKTVSNWCTRVLVYSEYTLNYR